MNAKEIEKSARAAVTDMLAASDLDELEHLRVRYLGRKGLLHQWVSAIPSLATEERRPIGLAINRAKAEIARVHEKRLAELQRGSPAPALLLDVTIPGKTPPRGTRHPITLVLDEMCDVFERLGFELVDGPEVETEFYNFTGLNIPEDHISRDPTQNFYITDKMFLRSQTSPVQIRVMQERKPPVRIISAGRVYRPDTVDALHHFMFHQVEGLMVDEGVSFADLKSVLNLFAKALFGEEAVTRVYPHYFPFTEPSAELEVACGLCGGKGCPSCGSGWIEIGGCGMVHPNVFRAVGYDPEKYAGFAFGIGVDRVAMRRYGIADIRLLFENDIRFLSQFPS